MSLLRRLILALALSAGLAPAFAAPPPPVPALPDTERRTSYSISGTTCACAVNFQIYGDSTDVDNWIEVWINGVRYLSTDPTFGWSLSSATGSLGTIPRPITNAVLTFNAVQTGTVQIVSAQRPRRLTTFSENAGVAARDFNQALNGLTAQLRDTWDKTNDLTGRALISQPGVSLSLLPVPSACAGKFLGFDATGLIPQCLAGGAGSGNVVGPAISVVGDVALFANSTGSLLKDGGPSGLLSSYAGATADVQLLNAIAAGATAVQLTSTASFFNTTPINLPANFSVNCNGNFIVQGANVSPSLFTMGSNSQFINCFGNGNGQLFTGDFIDIVTGSGQSITNTTITNVNNNNWVLKFAANAGGNFTWENGQASHTSVTTNPVIQTVSELSTTGPRFFNNVNMGGYWGYDFGGHYSVIQGGSMVCATWETTSSYVQISGGTRMACTPTIFGTFHNINAIFDGGATIGAGTTNSIIFAQPGLTITDSSGNATNQIVPAASNTYAQYMAGGNTIGWELFQAGSGAMAIGTNASNNPFIHSGNNLPVVIGNCASGFVSCTDYWQHGNDGSLISIGVTGGSKGANTINAAGLYVNGAALTATPALTVGTTVINSGNANGLLYDNGGVLGNPVTCNSGVWITGAGGVPTCGTALPSGLSIPGPGISNATITGTSSYNGNAWTTGTGTLTLGASKIFTVNNTLTLAGTDSTTMTFPTTSATIARTDAGQTFTGTQTFGTIAPTTINAFTLGGTISGGGNNINNVIIGAVTPLAGTFTTLGSGTHTIAASGVPLSINSTNSAQNIQMQAAGVTTAFFGGAAGTPLFVQDASGINVVAFNFSGSAAAVVNSPVFTAGPTGTAPIFGVTGTDTNIDLQIAPKGTGNIQVSNASSMSANGAVATALTSVGPTGSHTTVQEWLTIKNSSGTVRYIPAF